MSALYNGVMVRPDLRKVEDCGHIYYVDSYGRAYHQCPKCFNNQVSEDYMETHDDMCEECYNATHQCENCGDVCLNELEPACDGMRYCDQCRKDMLKGLLDDMKAIKSTAGVFGIVTAKVGKHEDSYLHIIESDFDQFKELMDWETKTEPFIEGYDKESIDINGIEIMCIHEIEAVKEQGLKEAV